MKTYQKGFIAVWAALLLGFTALVAGGGYLVSRRYAVRSLRRSLDGELQAAAESAVVLAVGKINHDAATRDYLSGASQGKEIVAFGGGDITAKAYALPNGDGFRVMAVATSPRLNKYERNKPGGAGTRAAALIVKSGGSWVISRWTR